MTDNPESDIQAAARVGNHAATTDATLAAHGDAIKDELHHLGDDTGRIITRAYRSSGPVDAADVIDSYVEAFNAVRSERGRTELDPRDAIGNLQWAITDDGITRAEQDEVRAEFARRHP